MDDFIEVVGALTILVIGGVFCWTICFAPRNIEFYYLNEYEGKPSITISINNAPDESIKLSNMDFWEAKLLVDSLNQTIKK